jgi:hypothetical protein
MIIKTAEEFIDKFGFRETRAFKEKTTPNDLIFRLVRDVPGQNNPVNYADWLFENVKENDDPRKDMVEWFYLIHEFVYEDPAILISKWFDDHLKFSGEVPFFDFKEIMVDGVINGKTDSHSGRILKNLFCDEVYMQTTKTTTRNVTSTIGILLKLMDYNINHSSIFVPSFKDILVNKDYDAFFAYLRGITGKASIFNPYTYFYILQTQFDEGEDKKLLCPVMSWGAPVIAFHNAWNYKEMVGIDVIPDVLNKSMWLHQQYQNRKTMFSNPKLFSIICKPSEDIWRDKDMVPREEYFDTVFFCPPYFDCELYPDPNGNQSTTRYRTYQEWLDGYWEPTLALCARSLKPGGQFGFVIVRDYTTAGAGSTHYPISDDMKSMAEKYFKHEKTVDLSWGGFKINKQNHDKRENVVEHVHIMRKL